MPQAMTATIVLKNMLGQTVKTVFNGNIPAGESNYFINVKTVASGNYVVVLEGENGRSVQKLVIR
jgi:hypothetical protein